jgi:hypothetical protein
VVAGCTAYGVPLIAQVDWLMLNPPGNVVTVAPIFTVQEVGVPLE